MTPLVSWGLPDGKAPSFSFFFHQEKWQKTESDEDAGIRAVWLPHLPRG